MNYYNEIDPFCCKWLANLMDAGLIPQGKIDQRSIKDVQPRDLDGFTQCHFFAGIAGWCYALQLAGWPEDRPCWTGSCPCQPFSPAGRQKGVKDERHLWPEFYRLIRECRPATVFGEQEVARAKLWLDGVCDDLENIDFAVGSAVLPAVSVGAQHFRYRIYFVADSLRTGLEGIYEKRGRVDLQSVAQNVSANKWKATPRVLQRIDGFSRKLDRPSNYREQIEAYGNAIVPQVAAEFIKAYMEVLR